MIGKKFGLFLALLHNSGSGQVTPTPAESQASATVTGMPSRLKVFRIAQRTWISATCHSG